MPARYPEETPGDTGAVRSRSSWTHRHAGRTSPRTEVVQIAFLRRLLGRDDPARTIEVPVPVAPLPSAPAAPAAVPVACPNCGVVLDPPPTGSRLCPRCRHRIVVRHSEGRAIYLTEAAVEVFEAERVREAQVEEWTRERRTWLQLARGVGAPADRRRRLERAPLTAATVQSARSLYLITVEHVVRAARREKRWDDVARLRQRQAAALFEEAGGVPPPAEEVLVLHREAMAANLRALAAVSREAELVGASCCAACRAGDERIFKIADELRTPRLPHADCPRGLCACDWWPVMRKPVTKRRRRRAAAAAPAAPRVPADPQTGAVPAPGRGRITDGGSGPLSGH